jgi:hypothetical protein
MMTEKGYLVFNTHNYPDTLNHLTKNAQHILTLPLDDMPLHINDFEYEVQGVAMWRLQIGK